MDQQGDRQSLKDMIDLLKMMLNKDVKKRITLEEIANHKWITCNGTWPCNWSSDVDYLEFADPKDEELNKEVSKINIKKTVLLKKKD